VIEPAQREALDAVLPWLNWALNSDDLWRSQGTLHVAGLNESALGNVIATFTDAGRDPDFNPLGVVVRGQAGSGKTHMLSRVRERVQADGGFFFLVELLDATTFWQSACSGILESLGRAGAKHETQLKDLLWQLSSDAHIPRADRRAIVGDDELTPQVLDEFVNTLCKVHPQTMRRCRHTLRALTLLGAVDPGLQDLGEAFINANDRLDDAEDWGLPASTLTPQESVRDISRIVAVAGPTVLAVDQIDTLLAQARDRTDGSGEPTDNRDLEHVAHGLMSIRQTMRRTVVVLACLPAIWESIQLRAAGPVADRFRTSTPLQGLPTAEVGRAILERRFGAGYATVGFTPPHPSWPIAPETFTDAPDYTPRQLLKRVDEHVRWCLAHDTVKELPTFHSRDADDETVETPTAHKSHVDGLDARFGQYRRRAVTAAVLDHEGEDTTMPELLGAALKAWIAERDTAEDGLRVDPPPGARVGLHARLRQSLDSATEDERHWGFRAIAASNPVAVQNRIRRSCDATGFGTNLDRRKLFLLRNTPWPKGPKTVAMIADFEASGGRTLAMSDDDLRTMIALRDLIDDNDESLNRWLAARKPAHSIGLLRQALGEHGEAPPPVPQPEEPSAGTAGDPAKGSVPEALSPTTFALGVNEPTGQMSTVELAALRKHTAIFAGSGSGKTVLIRRLVEECALRGVSSIVLDPNNDLARLGTGWPAPPPEWDPADTPRAADYLSHTEVVVWTPNRTGGRPLSFQPLPDFASVADDADEFTEAVDSAVAALEPRALIAGNTAKAHLARAVLREVLQWYGHQPSTTLQGFLDVLADLPPNVSGLNGASLLAAQLSQNLRASMVNDAMFGGTGTPADPGALLTPSAGYRARVSVISMIGLTNEQLREGFVNQLQMALFAWIKRHPAGQRPLGGLLVMDEAQNFAPQGRQTACLRSTLALSSQARKYGLGLVFATQAPKGLHNHIPGNAATQFYGLLNSPAQIATATEFARVKGGRVPDISKLRAGNFYAALEGAAFQRIRTPWCLSYHPPSPLTTEEVLELARRPQEFRPPVS
jgi:Helicase HerA, central domain